MKTALVTGAAGFIGSHLSRELTRVPDLRVIVLDDLSGGFRENLPAEVLLVEGSITDETLVATIFERYKPSYVYHLAAYAAEGLSHFIRRFNYQTNLVGSVNLINESVRHEIECFVFTSSIAVYGAAQVPMSEDMTPQPEDPYGISKYAVELDLRAANHMFGLNYVIFRPHNVYGEYQNIGDRYRNVVGIFMNQILQGKPITIYGDGSQQRAFSYVADIAGPIASAAWTERARLRTFNVGADLPTTVRELAQKVATSMGRPEYPVVCLEARKEVEVAFADHSAIRGVFGPATATPLADGLARMARWVNKVGARESTRFKNIELERSLPRTWLAT
jgi:UDP-glucose 4-epimerase